MTRRTYALAVLAVGAPAVAVAASPSWTRQAGLDVWNLPGLNRWWDEEVARQDRIAVDRDEYARRTRVKRAVMAEVAAGQLDLAGAAAEFLALDAARPMHLTALRYQFPDGPDERRAAQAVLLWARGPWSVPPEVADRLEAEFRTLYPAG